MAESFGSYTLISPIGVGGMAEVFLARHAGVEGFERDVVIKRIRPHLSATTAFVNMFLGEAKLASQLAHPNIVQIYDLGKIDESFFIAMEYIAGRDLAALIPKAKNKGIPFPVEYALKIVRDVCGALHYAHTKSDTYGHVLNIVHRDVSPENIRIAWTGSVKILDFGIAKAATQLHETKAGEIKGKLSYMSPEQISGKEVDNRTDIFSLGVVLYECLAGMKLFSGDSDLAIMNSIVDHKINPLSYFRSDIPDDVEHIVMKALEKDRKKRYQDAFEFQLDIDKFLARYPTPPSDTLLAGWLKNQLFKEEIEAEERRRRETPLPRPQKAQSSAPTQLISSSGAAIPPSPPAALLEAEREQTQEGLLLSLPDTAFKKLRKLAEQRGCSMEEIVQDVVIHYIKYH